MKFSIRRTWQRVRTVPGLGRDVTAVLVVVALAVAAGGYMLSNYGVHFFGNRQFEFSGDFSSAPGVAAGNHQEVRIAGVKIGTITDARPGDNGTAHVTMSIDPQYKIYSNAQLILRTKNPINEMYVEVNPGGPPATPLPAEATIPATQTQRPVQSYEILDNLDAKTRTALTSLLDASDAALATAPKDLPAGLERLNNAAENFKPVFQSLATRRQKIQQLVTALSQVAAAVGKNDDRLTSLIDSLQRTLGTLASNDSGLDNTLSQLPGFSGQLRDAMDSTQGLTGQLNPTLDNLRQASGGLPSTLTKLSGTADELGRTVQAARPVVAKAGPVVNDLKPVVADLQSALGDLAPITHQLNDVTARVVPWMNDLAAFVYNTSSMCSISDANGTFFRGQLTIMASNPTGLGPAQGGK